MTDKELFIKLVNEKINREGIGGLLAALDRNDFFTAPCSTKYHLACTGGLVKHSLNVYNTLVKLNNEYKLGFSDETIAICGLFHDLCKANFYVADGKGGWTVKDQFPCGHGEKSVIILQNFIRLTTDEILAIRWHMSSWDAAVKGGDYSLNSATAKTKLVAALQLADQIATGLLED